MSGFTIIAKRFTPETFADYVSGVVLPGVGGFNPSFCVLHNTSVPTLAQRPNGFTEQHMVNLEDYYSGLGWSGGPHVFADDRGLWVFNPLNRRGTHSPSWNGTSFGVEMLGEYDSEGFDSGRGAVVRDNAVAAIAILNRKMGVSASTMRLHKEDTATTHKNCPGVNVRKSDFIARVAAYMTSGNALKPKAWSVETEDGERIIPNCDEITVTAAVRVVTEKAFGGSIEVDNAKKVITVHRPK